MARRSCTGVARTAAKLEAWLEQAAQSGAERPAVWSIHLKQTSRLRTDFNQNDVRAAGLARGWVDCKVCAIDADWSGLKFARRKAGDAEKRRVMRRMESARSAGG